MSVPLKRIHHSTSVKKNNNPGSRFATDAIRRHFQETAGEGRMTEEEFWHLADQEDKKEEERLKRDSTQANSLNPKQKMTKLWLPLPTDRKRVLKKDKVVLSKSKEPPRKIIKKKITKPTEKK